MSDTSFRQAFAVLQRHSDTLRNQREPNIDDLLTIVTESVDAYKVCSARINAVEQALEEALGGAGIADRPTGQAGPRAEANPPDGLHSIPPDTSSDGPPEDDVPF